MSNYNLTDNVNESFEFSINGAKYTMRYPLMEELEKAQKLTEEREKTEDDQKKIELGKELESFMYQFITPVDSQSEPIGDVLNKQNVKVLQNFNVMIKTEFGIK